MLGTGIRWLTGGRCALGTGSARAVRSAKHEPKDSVDGRRVH